MIKRICQQCGKHFNVDQCQINLGGGKFCSNECCGKSKRKKVKRICQHCGIEFYTYPYCIKVGRGKFCSKECANKSICKRVKKVCQHCGDEFYTNPSSIKRGGGKFCSNECMKSIRGSNHKLWKGNKVGYTALHIWVRQNKPKPNACEICGKITTKLEAANISGGYKRDINDFVYLCKKCHRRFDNIKKKNPNIKPLTILKQQQEEIKNGKSN